MTNFQKVSLTLAEEVYNMALDFASEEFEGNLSAAVNRALRVFFELRKNQRIIVLSKGTYVQNKQEEKPT